MSDEEDKDAKARRVYGILMLLLRSKELSNAVAKIAITMTKGGYDPEQVSDLVSDAMGAFTLDAAEALRRVNYALFMESRGWEPGTDHEFDQWHRRMVKRRHDRKRVEKLK